MTLLFTFCAMVLAATFFFLRPHAAETGTHADVADRLVKLKNDPNPMAFLGFCTRDDDALYFVYEGDRFNLDYELNTAKKKVHEKPFRDAAADLNFVVIDTTYGDFPVLRISLDQSETHAAKAGFDFAQRMFGHDETTVIEFLP